MRARRVLIHVGRGRFSVSRAEIHCLLNLRNALNDQTGEVLYEYALLRVLFEVKFFLLSTHALVLLRVC